MEDIKRKINDYCSNANDVADALATRRPPNTIRTEWSIDLGIVIFHLPTEVITLRSTTSGMVALPPHVNIAQPAWCDWRSHTH